MYARIWLDESVFVATNSQLRLDPNRRLMNVYPFSGILSQSVSDATICAGRPVGSATADTVAVVATLESTLSDVVGSSGFVSVVLAIESLVLVGVWKINDDCVRNVNCDGTAVACEVVDVAFVLVSVAVAVSVPLPDIVVGNEIVTVEFPAPVVIVTPPVAIVVPLAGSVVIETGPVVMVLPLPLIGVVVTPGSVVIVGTVPMSVMVAFPVGAVVMTVIVGVSVGVEVSMVDNGSEMEIPIDDEVELVAVAVAVAVSLVENGLGREMEIPIADEVVVAVAESVPVAVAESVPLAVESVAVAVALSVVLVLEGPRGMEIEMMGPVDDVDVESVAVDVSVTVTVSESVALSVAVALAESDVVLVVVLPNIGGRDMEIPIPPEEDVSEEEVSVTVTVTAVAEVVLSVALDAPELMSVPVALEEPDADADDELPPSVEVCVTVTVESVPVPVESVPVLVESVPVMVEVPDVVVEVFVVVADSVLEVDVGRPGSERLMRPPGPPTRSAQDMNQHPLIRPRKTLKRLEKGPVCYGLDPVRSPSSLIVHPDCGTQFMRCSSCAHRRRRPPARSWTSHPHGPYVPLCLATPQE